MNYIKIMIILVAIALVSCAPKERAAQVEPVPIKEGEQVITKESWEEKWERILTAAKKEGVVVVVGGSAAAALKTNAAKIIKDKFGLKLEVITGRSGDTLAKMRMERANGIFTFDIFTGGQSTVLEYLKTWGWVDPIEPILLLPEVIDPNLWFDGRLNWADEDKTAYVWAGYPSPGIVVNTAMIQPSEIKSYYDLLDPRWKGKIVMDDPTIAGSGFSSFTALIFNKALDLDFFRQLVERQQITMLREQHLQINWVIRGKFPIGLWTSAGRLKEYTDAGATIDFVTAKEGVELSSGGAALALVNRAPHPNAATIVFNWLLSKEGQLVLQNSVDKQSLRIDLSTAGLDPKRTRQPGVKYLTDPRNDEQWLLHEREKYRVMAQEIFAPLTGR